MFSFNTIEENKILKKANAALVLSFGIWLVQSICFLASFSSFNCLLVLLWDSDVMTVFLLYIFFVLWRSGEWLNHRFTFFASFSLQESNCQLEGESGYTHLKIVTSKLRKRQQYMVSQVSFIYPLKIEAGPSQDQELESLPGGSRLGQLYYMSLNDDILWWKRDQLIDSWHCFQH